MKSLYSSPRWLGLAWKVTAVVAILLALVVGLGGQGDNGASAATSNVNVGQKADLSKGNEFNPNDITIFAGDTVQWDWFDGNHNVTSYDETVPGTPDWASSVLQFSGPGDTWSWTFLTPGTYTYYCTFHASRNDANPASPNFGKMVGRITVQAAPSDTTPPTTSAVAALPNPTNGASSTTLTATVAESGSPTTAVAEAEYFVDSVGADGTGTAMSATDGSFDSDSENVTASVNVSGLSLGSHTLYVHGRDGAGNWGATASVVLTVSAPPAGSESATVTILGGTLSVTTNPVAFGTISLTGVDQTVDTSPTAWSATDARGNPTAGWNVTLTSTDFSSTGGTITVENFKMRLLDANIVTVSGNAPPTSQATSYQPLSSSTPLKLLSAAAGTGMGTYDFTPDGRLNVPAESVPGSYEAFMTVSVNSGP